MGGPLEFATQHKIRGHVNMIAVFDETLFKEAVFDDAGAW
jgi:hypothetical protein